ncbi:MAG: pyruvate kinase alpha/beta domain-containing protein, partial [Acidimicrobiales bacterium]
ALELDAVAIVACTRSGATARAISRFRPKMPIVAVTTTEHVRRQLAVSWGVEATVAAETETTDDVIHQGVAAAVAIGAAKKGDIVVALAGSPLAEVSVADTLQVIRVS